MPENNPELSTITTDNSMFDAEVGQAEDQRNLFRKIISSPAGRLVTAGLVTVGTVFSAEQASEPVEAVASTPIENAGHISSETTDMQTTTTVRVGHSEESVKSASKLWYVGNYRTVSRAVVKQAKRAGNCQVYSGKQAIKLGIMTQGYMGTGVGYAYENRDTTGCDTNGDGVPDTRSECGNKIKITHKSRPAKARLTVWMNNLAKQKLHIKSRSVATAKASCELDGVSATAYGRGVGYASAKGLIKNAMRRKGKLSGPGYMRLRQQSVAGANFKASTSAYAKAKVRCEEGGGEVKPPQPPHNAPPTADLEGHVHSITEDEVAVRCYVDDPDGLNDIKNVSITESGTGSFISYAEQVSPGVYEREFSAGPVEGEAVVTCTATDRGGEQGSDTERWPIVKINTPW